MFGSKNKGFYWHGNQVARGKNPPPRISEVVDGGPPTAERQRNQPLSTPCIQIYTHWLRLYVHQRIQLLHLPPGWPKISPKTLEHLYHLIWFENHIYNINCVSPKLASSFSHSTGGDLASEKQWVAQMVSASATITRLELKAARVAMPVKSRLGHRSILPVSLKFCLTIPFSSQQLANWWRAGHW